jgi:protein gp37
MGEVTNIGWTVHTGSPTLGCTKVSDECTNCYAWVLALSRMEHIFRQAYRKAGFADWETRAVWGDKAVRVVTKGFWKDAYRLNAKAARAGKPEPWFPSLMDWLDLMPAGVIDQDGNNLEPVAVLADFLRVVMNNRWLVWQLLTKRPQNFEPLLESVIVHLHATMPEDWEELADWVGAWLNGNPPAHVWVGVTCGVEKEWERLEKLKRIPAAIRFVSVEPLLEDLELLLKDELSAWACRECGSFNVDTEVQVAPGDVGTYKCNACGYMGGGEDAAVKPLIDWVIIGCESDGHKVGRESARYSARALRLIVECKEAGVKCYHKQMPVNGRVSTEMKEWPEAYRVREFPEIHLPSED